MFKCKKKNNLRAVYFHQTHFSYRFNFKRGVNFFKKHPKLFFADIFDNIGGEAEGIIWPIFVYLSVVNIVSVGIIGAILGLSSIIFTIIVGIISDKFSKKKIIRIAAVFACSVWFFRMFIDSEFMFYLSSVLSGFFVTLLVIPYTAKMEKNDEYYVFKELPSCIGRVIIFAVVLVCIGNIKMIFPIAGLAYLYFLFW